MGQFLSTQERFYEESSDVGRWSNLSDAPTLEVSDEMAYEGTRSLKISAENTNEFILGFPYVEPFAFVSPGNTVTASARLYCPSSSEFFQWASLVVTKLGVETYMGETVYPFLGEEHITGEVAQEPGTWTALDGEMVVPAGVERVALSIRCRFTTAGDLPAFVTEVRYLDAVSFASGGGGWGVGQIRMGAN